MTNYGFGKIGSEEYYGCVCKIGYTKTAKYSVNYEYYGYDLDCILDGVSKEKAKELEKELKEKGECSFIDEGDDEINFIITYKKFLLKEKKEREHNIKLIKKEIKKETSLEMKENLVGEAEDEISKLYGVLEELAMIDIKEMLSNT